MISQKRTVGVMVRRPLNFLKPSPKSNPNPEPIPKTNPQPN